ncbi:MAG: DNA polymerase III subunit delta' [Defluviitaleaceae bacterium]|nr:DNA polymerase III subunit delta' [Defluviitaleaceae bacterium]
MYSYTDVLGQENIKNHLRKAVSRGRVSHAYIFSGAQGMGKGALARALAKTLQCMEGGAEPCGRCASCRAFDGGNHPDVFYIGLSGKKSLGVDDVREKITAEMEIKPYSGKYKIFIIDDAETLTPAAQNALLKTIEEPAPYGVFLFLSANDRQFLPTVLSRCVLLKLTPVPPKAVEDMLLKRGVPKDKAAFVSAYSQGNPGLALRLCESEDFMEIKDEVTEAAREIHGLDCAEALGRYPAFEKYRDRFDEVLDILLLFYRDELISREDGAPRLAVKELLSKFDAVLAAKRAMAANANFQMAAEVMLMNLSADNAI